jgi:hypothetical protein
MLQGLSEPVRACHERALEAKRWADETSDPALKASYLDMERHWLVLARKNAAWRSTATIACRAERRQFVICFGADLPLWGQCLRMQASSLATRACWRHPWSGRNPLSSKLRLCVITPGTRLCALVRDNRPCGIAPDAIEAQRNPSPTLGGYPSGVGG